MKRLRVVLAGLLAASVWACSPPKYVPYKSIQGDWSAVVPYAWDVMTDQEDKTFTNTSFIGPFDPEFFLGAPSFSVRWYSYKKAHRLRDGLVEYYRSVDDFIDQMLRGVYGPDYHLVDEENPSREAPISDVKVAGRAAKHFAVLSAASVRPETKWGTSTDPESGRLVNVRLHEYLIIPLETGFYVLVYPATLKGFKYYKPQFNAFAHGFKLSSEGPQGRP
jgi:hypothetical protein